MPVSRRRPLDKKRANRNRRYRQVVHQARVLALRGRIKWIDFLKIRAIAFGRLHEVAARLRQAVAPTPGAGVE